MPIKSSQTYIAGEYLCAGDCVFIAHDTAPFTYDDSIVPGRLYKIYGGIRSKGVTANIIGFVKSNTSPGSYVDVITEGIFPVTNVQIQHGMGNPSVADKIFAATSDSVPYTISASTVYSATYAAWKAFDHLSNTQWCTTNGQTTNQWVQINVGSGNEFICNKWRWKNGSENITYGPKRFKLQGSNNGTFWIDLDTTYADKDFTQLALSQWSEWLTFYNIVSYQYYRMFVISNYSGAYIEVTEIELVEALPYSHTSITGDSNASNIDRIPTMSSNTAPSPLTASASSEFDSTFAAWRAFDNSDTNYWCTVSGQVTNQWVQINLGTAAFACNKFRLKTTSTSSNYNPKRFKLQGSNNGTDWTDLFTKYENTDYRLITTTVTWTEWFTFTNSTVYQYYRLYVISTQNSTTYLGVGEIELVTSQLPVTTGEFYGISSYPGALELFGQYYSKSEIPICQAISSSEFLLLPQVRPNPNRIYVGCGYDGGRVSTIDGFRCSDESRVIWTYLVTGRSDAGSFSSPSSAYWAGGYVSGVTNNVEIMSFNNGTCSSLTTLSQSKQFLNGGCQSIIAGYIWGGSTGSDQNSPTTVCEKLTFSTSTAVSLASAALPAAKSYGGQINGGSKCYYLGGATNTSTRTSTIYATKFSDETISTLSATLSQVRHVGPGVASRTKTYIMGGQPASGVCTNIDALKISDETSFIASVLVTSRATGGGGSSATTAYACCGDIGSMTGTSEAMSLSTESCSVSTTLYNTYSRTGVSY